jgi:hypothetical protein
VGGGGAGDVIDWVFEEAVVSGAGEGVEGVQDREKGEEVCYEICLRPLHQ